ncbi:MAG: short-chain dehydrogenase [Candidatus Kapaibacteriota bacterium]
MQITGAKILILGGWGLVGSAICRKLMSHNPAKLIVTSLRESEAKEAVEDLRKEYKNVDPNMFEAKWGNLFTRNEWKDNPPSDVINNKDSRNKLIEDIFNDLDNEVLSNSSLYTVMKETSPDLVIDCINTATGIAYLDIFKTTNQVKHSIAVGNLQEDLVEKLMASAYVPQLIRHVQILSKGLVDSNSKMYIKVGTTGTGGMGMNIPYTHSEERPSRVLMAKTAVAGAHSMLMYLMARTPNSPIIKEIKPAATIAWKKIAYGEIRKGGKPIQLVDMGTESPLKLENDFDFNDRNNVVSLNENLKSVYIDTGENGIFSRGEFQAISSLGQMEIVTPEEIADYVVFEAIGGNTGKEVMQGLDAFTLGPTYRGGIMQQTAIKKLENLEKSNNVESVAFELLGPPRLSKLLYEAYILWKISGNMSEINNFSSKELSENAKKYVSENQVIRAQILSIGLPIILDENTYLKGDVVKIPVRGSQDKINLTDTNVNKFAYEGWVDLRKENFETWIERVNNIMNQANEVDDDDSSSRYTYTKDYWNNFENYDPGKIGGWIFENEDKGWRFKR